MDNVDIIYMDDDFSFDKKNNQETEIIDVDESLPKIEKKDIYKETYNVIDNYKKMKNQLKTKNNEYELLNVKYESLLSDYETLNKLYQREQKEHFRRDTEIKELKKEIIDKKKRILMLKSLLELIINKYGIENISKITRLNLEQIQKYMD